MRKGEVIGLRSVWMLGAALSSINAFAFSSPTPEHQGLQRSGQLIVHPLPLENLIARGCSTFESLALQQRARLRVRPYMTAYLRNTDDIIIAVPSGRSEDTFTKELLASGDYQYAEPNWICKPCLTPNDPQYGAQWAWPKVKAPHAWDTTQGDVNVVVAGCDTGIQHSHPDLSASLVLGYNAASHQSELNGGQTEDINGHGTHTAGTMAAIGNNGVGVCGATWRCRIMPIRVTNDPGGSTTLATILEGAQWAVDHGATVINVSYAGVTDPAVETTGAYIKSRGGLLCYSAGSSGSAMPPSSDWEDVTIVGATDPNDARASFSDYGVPIDLMAPGIDILSTYLNGSYQLFSGTSMAAPHVAGAFALLLSKDLGFTPSQLETFLYSTAHDLGAPGNDNTYGWGRVDYGAAMDAANDYVNLHLTPNSYRWITGTQVDGALLDLGASDDRYLRGHGNMLLQPGEPIVLEIDFGSPTDTISSLILNFEAHNSQPMLMTLRLKRWSDGIWVDVDQRVVGMSDSGAQISVANAQQFVRSGDGLIQARCGVRLGPAGGQPRMDSSFDLFTADIQP